LWKLAAAAVAFLHHQAIVSAPLVCQITWRCDLVDLVSAHPSCFLLPVLLTQPPSHPQATSLDTVEDLDEDAKPEDLMLSYVSGDKSKVRLWFWFWYVVWLGAPAARSIAALTIRTAAEGNV